MPEGLPSWIPFFGGGDDAPRPPPGWYLTPPQDVLDRARSLYEADGAPSDGSPGQPPPADIPLTPAAPATPIVGVEDLPLGGLLPPGVLLGPGGSQGLSGESALVALGARRQSLSRELARLLRRLNPTRPPTRGRVVDRTGRIKVETLPSALEAAVGMAAVRWALAVGSGIAGVLYPSPTAVSTVPGFDTPEERAARQIRAAMEDARRAVDSPSRYDQDRIRRGELPEFPSDPREGPVPMRDISTPPNRPTEFGQRVLDAALSGNVYDRDWLRDQITRAVEGDRQVEDYPSEPAGELYEYTPPSEVYQAPPPTMPAPQTVTPPPAPRGGTAVRRIVGALQNPAARYAVIGLGIATALRGRRGGQTAVLNAPGAAISPTPATSLYPYSVPSALTRFDAGSVSSTRTAGCSCSTKKRGPKRKCLERGSVAWRTGRFKGRTAGTKCIRYARN